MVVRPRDTDEIAATLAVARETACRSRCVAPGTSIAGNAVGPGIVVDTSRHLNRVLELDREARTARVQPGVVHAALQRQAVPAGLRFGPDPSTHTRCTIGGMIGNNACGSRALGYGRTVDNVEALTVLLADGTVVTASPVVSRRSLDARSSTTNAGPSTRSTRWSTQHLDVVRTEFGRFGRQVSGYSFEHLLPENGRRFDRFLVGTEGTLGVVLDATVRLVEDAPARALAVLGLPDDGRRRGRRTRTAGSAARPAARRLRGAGPAHRRHGDGPSRAARRRRLAVRRGHRPATARGGSGARAARSPAPPASRTGSSPTPSSSWPCGGSARTAPAWPPAR